jgi:RHS repeat-associated protein
VGVSGRATTQGYVSESVRQGFTSYERDDETGLDYAQVRYYGSSMGRFTSPDPYMPSAQVASPQTWNRYTYVLNNPLNYVDPTGLDFSDLSAGQLRVFQTYADKYNKQNKTKLTAEEVYATLDEAQMATFEAITYALEHTQLTDKKLVKALAMLCN